MPSNATGDGSATLLACLRIGRFRRLLGALASSQLGDWIYNYALLTFMYERTHSAAWVGATTAARLVPLLVLGPVGGLVADRCDRRRLMMTCDGVRAALMIALGVVAATGLPVVLAPLLAALATAVGTPHTPCVVATMPRLVAAPLLTHANALRSGVRQCCIMAGPAIGALLVVLGSYGSAFVFNAGSFALAALMVASMAGPGFAPPARDARPLAAGARRAIASELWLGAAAIQRSAAASVFVAADVLCSAIYGAQKVLLLLLVDELGASPGGFGAMLAAVGAGGVLGAALTGRCVHSAGTRPVLLGALVTVAVSTSALGFAGSLAVGLALAFASGASLVIAEILAQTGLQQALDDAVLARASAFAVPAAVAGLFVGSLVAAPLASLLGGPAGALAALGGVIALFAVGVACHRGAAVAPSAQPAPSAL